MRTHNVLIKLRPLAGFVRLCPAWKSCWTNPWGGRSPPRCPQCPGWLAGRREVGPIARPTGATARIPSCRAACIPLPAFYLCCCGKNRGSVWKLSSTGWGRYSYSPSPQTGRPCRALRLSQFLLGIPKQNLAQHAILTGRLCLPIILADLSKYGGICHRHQTSSAVSWRLRLIALSLLRRLAFRRGLPGNTMRRTRVRSWQRLCETCRGMTHNAGSGV